MDPGISVLVYIISDDFYDLRLHVDVALLEYLTPEFLPTIGIVTEHLSIVIRIGTLSEAFVGHGNVRTEDSGARLWREQGSDGFACLLLLILAK